MTWSDAKRCGWNQIKNQIFIILTMVGTLLLKKNQLQLQVTSQKVTKLQLQIKKRD